MKTKTIFEGVINGEKFNNVKDYNSRLTSLLHAGAKVDAQANTRTVEDKGCDKCEMENCNCKHENKLPLSLAVLLKKFEMDIRDLTPGFGAEADSIFVDMFTDLDKVNNEELEDIDVEDMTEILSDEYIEQLKDVINEMSHEDLYNYFKYLHEIVMTIERRSTAEQAKAANVAIEHNNNKRDFHNKENEMQGLKDKIKEYTIKLHELEAEYDKLTAEYNKIADELDYQAEYANKFNKFHELVKIFREFYRPVYNQAKLVLNKNTDQSEIDTNFKETKKPEEKDFAVGNNKEAIAETADKLQKVINKVLGVGLDKNPNPEAYVPSIENAAHLFRDIFGDEAADAFLNSVKHKRK